MLADVTGGSTHWLSEPGPPFGAYLFHYTTARGMRGIVTSGTYRLGTWHGLNDPRESKQWRVAEVIQAGSPDAGGPLVLAPGLEDELDRVLRGGARLGCFTIDQTPAADAVEGGLFHRGWARAAMWDRYADRHAGACLVFDQGELIGGVEAALPAAVGDIRTWGAVTYVDAPLAIPLTGTFTSARELLDGLDELTDQRGVVGHLYMTKNRDWESEREFRVVVVLWDAPAAARAEPIAVPLQPCLRAIVLGEAFADAGALRLLLEERLASERPEVLRCVWRAGAPFLAVA